MESKVNEISELRNTILSPCNLNTVVAIVTSNLVELLGNRILVRVCYLPMESGVQT